jgi:acyl-CoA synthetase (AMP-forming)/AMP-acid ligase II
VPSLHDLVRAHAQSTPSAPALGTPSGRFLTYDQLVQEIDAIRADLNGFGIGRDDRVALVLPNGLDMAVAFLGVTAAATCAPLNPAYRAAEFEFYLSDLGAKGLITNDPSSPAVEVARKLKLEIVRVGPAAGTRQLTLDGPAGGAAARPGVAALDDTALVLHTSGTTARPKIVSLTQRNLLASARNIQATLQLGPSDRCLNVMPLFHIHGLIGCLLSSMFAGASVVCTSQFSATEVLEWLATTKPTWYSAVPTIHQAVLEAAVAAPQRCRDVTLRFIRSSSSALAPSLCKELERVFGTVVVEAYGMTEASHQIASNPLPPGTRKLSSVGRAAGPEIAVLDPAGQPVPAGARGAIAIRGTNVITGYENNADANHSNFVNGWMLTGDEGHLDEEGYLFLTGRTKEMINRAGEKVAPREIDDLLLQHEAVAQAVTFAVPHSTLGEDVAAAVVLRPGATTTERELREFVRQRVAPFKVPQQFVIVDAIPKGATGKVQRLGLAEKLADRLRANFVAPRDALEEAFAMIWAAVLKLDRVGVTDNYFALGGDSLNAAIIVTRAQPLGVSSELIFLHPTIADIVAAHRDAVGAEDAAASDAAALEMFAEAHDRGAETTKQVETANPSEQRKPGILGQLRGLWNRKPG